MALEPKNEWAENYPGAVAWGLFDKNRDEVIDVTDEFDEMDEPWTDSQFIVPLLAVMPDQS